MSVIPSSGVAWGFQASDLFSNAVSLYSSIGGFILLILAVAFSGKLVGFIKRAVGTR